MLFRSVSCWGTEVRCVEAVEQKNCFSEGLRDGSARNACRVREEVGTSLYVGSPSNLLVRNSPSSCVGTNGLARNSPISCVGSNCFARIFSISEGLRGAIYGILMTG